jgi:hypothetical protein
MKNLTAQAKELFGKTKNDVKEKTSNAKKKVSKELIKMGLKKEDPEILEQIAHKKRVTLKTDFDKVYNCIENSITPAQVEVSSKMVKNFNTIYSENTTESKLLQAALELKFAEVCVGVFESCESNVRPMSTENDMEDIKNQLEENGYEYAVAIATKAEVEAGAACGQLSIICDEEKA